MKKLGLLLLGFWAILSVAALGHLLHDTAVSAGESKEWIQSESEVRLAWETAILNFPISALVITIGQALSPASTPGPIGEWALLTTAGLVQWGLLAPLLFRALRARLRNPKSAR